MKLCPKCKEIKEFSDFGKHKNRYDGVQSCCKACVSAYHTVRYKSDVKVKPRQRANNKKNVLAGRTFVSRYKAEHGCLFCPESDPIALDLHHLNPTIKDDNVSKLLGYSLESIMAEIKKCVVICSNCHRKHHAGVDGYQIDIAH